MRLASTTHFRKMAADITRDLKSRGYARRIQAIELSMLFKQFNGRCAYCGIPCIPWPKISNDRVYFHWYIPLDKGGTTEIKNLVPVCSEHKEKYRHVKTPRETIPDVNTFGDLIATLVDSTITMRKLKSDNNVEAFKWERKIQALKHSINMLLEEIMVSTHYKPFSDWKFNPIMHEEDVNTIPDLIEGMVKGEDNKDELTNAAKQLISTKQYKIIRKDD